MIIFDIWFYHISYSDNKLLFAVDELLFQYSSIHFLTKRYWLFLIFVNLAESFDDGVYNSTQWAQSSQLAT